MTKPYIKKDNNATFYYKDKAYIIRHREDGPAVEYSNGTKYWYLNGKLHRVDGPAIEFFDGTKVWHLNGKEYSEKEYEVLTKRKNLINFL